MNLTEIEAVIRGQLLNNFTSAPISWPNKHFAPTKDAPDGNWVRLTIRMAETQLKELGTDGTGERYGLLYLDVFTRKNVGSSVGSGLVDELEALFRRKSLSDVIFDEGTSSDLGVDTNNNELNHHQVKIPFFAFT